MWDDGERNGYHDGWQMMAGGSAFAWVLMMLVTIALVAASVAIILALRRPPGAPTAPGLPPETSARRALDERFARGEIDEDEYRSRRNVLLGA